ncbi:CoA transferase [Paenibacillaceae bacterium]|nr:CoA transferase [Paenibacillaceae bacterium]
MKLLDGLLVLDISQGIAGSFAALRLADLGARVIKVELREGGDAGRTQLLNDQSVDGESAMFHTLNRNKESYAVNCRDQADLDKMERLVAEADVLIDSTQPGEVNPFGLEVDRVRALNPQLIYGSVTGCGPDGPWQVQPAQDLLVQALTGMPWLNGNADEPPVPFGLSVTDLFASANLVQGILAALIRRPTIGLGAHVEISLLEAALDFQFEVLTTHLNDGGKLPRRSSVNNAHAYLGAPYGVYRTQDSYLSLAMGSIVQLGELLECTQLAGYQDPQSWFDRRDEIKSILADHLKTRSTAQWLAMLEPADYWCAKVLDVDGLLAHEGFHVLEMVQDVRRSNGSALKAMRCPIRVDGTNLLADQGAPLLGEHNERIDQTYGLNVTS